MDVEPVGANGFVLRGVRWATYVELDRARGVDNASPRLSYLDGVLEVMVTSPEHELRKTLLRRFLEAYAEVAEIALNGFGSMTFQDRAKEAGLEPDECYFIGKASPREEPADLAIEIDWSRSSVNKLEIYRRLGVLEVWLWENDQIEVYRLWGGEYRRRPRSVCMRELDLHDLARRVVATDPSKQTETVRAYRKWLQRRDC